jgi:hypothetical protein
MFVSFDFGRVGYLGPKRLVWSARDQVFKEFPPSPILFFSTNVIRLSLESRNGSFQYLFRPMRSPCVLKIVLERSQSFN